MKKYFITLTIAFCLIFFGVAASVIEMLNFSLENDFNNSNLNKKTVTYNLTKGSNKVELSAPLANNTTIIIDNTIPQGNYKVIVTYYNELLKLDKDSTTYANVDHVDINIDDTNSFNSFKKFLNVTLDGLKNKKIYNYYKALSPIVKVYVNENDKENITIKD